MLDFSDAGASMPQTSRLRAASVVVEVGCHFPRDDKSSSAVTTTRRGLEVNPLGWIPESQEEGGGDGYVSLRALQAVCPRDAPFCYPLASTAFRREVEEDLTHPWCCFWGYRLS
jgi:hypothetical protein